MSIKAMREARSMSALVFAIALMSGIAAIMDVIL